MKDNTGSLDELVPKAITVYNKYRSPEVTAKLVRVEKKGFILEFEGTFCQSCGVTEYFEDFIFDLEDIARSLRVKIKAIESNYPQSFRVEYAVRRDFSDGDVRDEELFREFLHDRGLSFQDYLTSNNCTKDIIKFHFRIWLIERKPESKK